MKIFFDESGQTGAHLLDRNQPYFTIGGTDIQEETATEIIKECFPRVKGNELKARSLFRRDSGRNAFLVFSQVVGKNPSSFCGAKVDKRFSVVSKMVDNLVEPIVNATGYDFYADNYAAKFANMAYFAFSNILGEEAALSLMETYNAFARSPTHETLQALQLRLEEEITVAPEASRYFLSMMSMGANAFEQLHDLNDFQDTNDLHLTAVLQCMGFWQERHDGPFEVIHDESTHFFRRSKLWETMTNPQVEAGTFQFGPKTLKLPINVVSTTASRSHECASLQLCDLIAGFINFVSNPYLGTEDADFAQRAIDSGMGQLSVFPVEPGNEFLDGPPREADGPDVIDRLIAAVDPRRN